MKKTWVAKKTLIYDDILSPTSLLHLNMNTEVHEIPAKILPQNHGEKKSNLNLKTKFYMNCFA